MLNDGITLSGNISGGENADAVDVQGNATVGTITLGITDKVSIAGGKTLTTDKLVIVNDAEVNIEGSGTLKGDVLLASTAESLLTYFKIVHASTIDGTITGNDGNDIVEWAGSATITGSIDLKGGANVLRAKGGASLTVKGGVDVKELNSMTIAGDGTLKGDVRLSGDGGGEFKPHLTLSEKSCLDGKVIGGNGADSVYFANTTSVTGIIDLGAGRDFLSLDDYTSTEKVKVWLEKGDALAFPGGSNDGNVTCTDGVDTIKVPANNTSIVLQVAGYEAKGTWKNKLEVTTLGNVPTGVDGDNKAYIVNGSYNLGTFNTNKAGVDWLIVYDADAGTGVQMETVLIVGLGQDKVDNLCILDNGTIGWAAV